jgi:carbamoyl-phosphate synthase large subunit
MAFRQFVHARRTLGTQMKATGEVMGISNSFEGALLKALRSMERGQTRLQLNKHVEKSRDELLQLLKNADDERLFVVAESIRRGISIFEINAITQIDIWFLDKVASIIDMEKELSADGINPENLLRAKVLGFTDKDLLCSDAARKKVLRKCARKTESMRLQNGDTCAAELRPRRPTITPVTQAKTKFRRMIQKKVLVLGSGPIRIGQGIEFDYCSFTVCGRLRAWKQNKYN